VEFQRRLVFDPVLAWCDNTGGLLVAIAWTMMSRNRCRRVAYLKLVERLAELIERLP
jgi:hypothetical protein